MPDTPPAPKHDSHHPDPPYGSAHPPRDEQQEGDLIDTADVSADRPTAIVTGSAGLLGRRVCERLADAGYFVFGFDRVGFPQPPTGDYVRDVEFDITDYANVRWAMEDVRRARGNRIDAVVHLAAYYDFAGEDSPLYEKVTVEGTDRLLNHLQSFEVGQFLFSSTMLVHAPCEVGEHITEDSPIEAKWPYPQSKVKTEKVITESHPWVRSVMLRIAGVYTDYGQQPTLVQQIRRIYERDIQARVFPGDKETGQSAVHIDDCVDAIIRTVERRGEIPPKTPILIGEPDPPTYGELQDAIGQLLHGKDWTTLRIPKVVAKVGAAVQDKTPGIESFIKPFMIDLADDHYALDITRARTLLRWHPRHSLLESLPTICKALQDDPEGWYHKNKLA